MNSRLLSICERYIKNRDIIKAAFPGENDYIPPVCASIFTGKEAVADVDTIKNYHKLLKEKVGAFSYLESGLLVLELGTLCLTSYNDTRGLVNDTDSRVGLVDVLSARTAGTVCGDLKILVTKLDLVDLCEFGHYLD